jgi:glucoamylase
MQLQAMLEEARLADRLGDTGAARFYRQQASDLTTALREHWNPQRQQIIATLQIDGNNFKPHQLDASVIVAALRADSPEHQFADRLYSPADDRILATAAKIARISRALYTINQHRTDKEGRALQPAVGRYMEDMYDGVRRENDTLGNPWVLTTAAMAELCYRSADQWADAEQISVSRLNREFLEAATASQGVKVALVAGQPIFRNDPRVRQILAGLIEYGDGFLRRIRFHADATGGSLSEQIDRESGRMIGAKDLTWNYAAILTTFRARDAALRKIGVSGSNAAAGKESRSSR